MENVQGRLVLVVLNVAIMTYSKVNKKKKLEKIFKTINESKSKQEFMEKTKQ